MNGETVSMAERWRPVDEAIVRARAYLESTHSVPVVPSGDALDALSSIPARLPPGPSDPQATIDVLDRIGSPATVHSNGGRYFGFVNGGTEPVGLAAAMLSLAWDQNAALPVMSPIAARLDEIAAGWVVELLGLPPTSTASFCAGASVANVTAIVAARDALLRGVGWDAADRGLVGAPPIAIIASEEIHSSVLKALRVAGLGSGAVVPIPTDACGRARPDAIPPVEGPALVLLQAGNVNTGHSDPFEAIIGRLDRDRTWVHVDGAFGLWANAAPDRRHLLAGVELADSWATDGHKWLNTPYDCGMAIVARADDLVASMRQDAAYAHSPGGRAPMNMGLQMSQAARAIPVWAILATLGRSGVAGIVERCCRNARRFADALQAAGAEILAPPVLNQVLVSFGDDGATDRVIAAVQADRTCWVGGTTWHGRRAMRVSVSDASTTAADVDTASAAVVRSWRA